MLQGPGENPKPDNFETVFKECKTIKEKASNGDIEAQLVLIHGLASLVNCIDDPNPEKQLSGFVTGNSTNTGGPLDTSKWETADFEQLFSELYPTKTLQDIKIIFHSDEWRDWNRWDWNNQLVKSFLQLDRTKDNPKPENFTYELNNLIKAYKVNIEKVDYRTVEYKYLPSNDYFGVQLKQLIAFAKDQIPYSSWTAHRNNIYFEDWKKQNFAELLKEAFPDKTLEDLDKLADECLKEGTKERKEKRPENFDAVLTGIKQERDNAFNGSEEDLNEWIEKFAGYIWNSSPFLGMRLDKRGWLKGMGMTEWQDKNIVDFLLTLYPNMSYEAYLDLANDRLGDEEEKQKLLIKLTKELKENLKQEKISKQTKEAERLRRD